MSACALTGHRVLGKGFSRERLEQCLRALIAEGGGYLLLRHGAGV